LLNKINKGYRPSRNLYKVSLHQGKTPDQYTWLEWDKKIDKKTAKKLTYIIVSKNPNQYSKGYTDFNKGVHIQAAVNLEKQISDMTGMEFYRSLSRGGYEFLYGDFAKELKTDKEASLFLLENGIDGIKYPAESIARGTTSDTARGFNYVVFDENAVTIEESMQFQASSLSRQARNYAYDLMGYYLDNGMTLEQAYVATRSDVSVMVISNSTGKGTSDQIAQDIESGVKDAFERRKAEQEQQQRDNKLNEAYMNQGVRDIMDNARQQAQRIKDNDPKASKTDAYETILNNVKQSITKLYESGEPPKGITWANMMRLAAPIANDAMLEAFPSTKGQVMYYNKTVTMKVSDVIRGAIAQQITAVKDINTRAKAIKAIVDDVLNTLTKKYGSRK
jgi:hypothetical protein